MPALPGTVRQDKCPCQCKCDDDYSYDKFHIIIMTTKIPIVFKWNIRMHKSKLLVLDDYEGELANAPDMLLIQQLADVTILDRPLGVADYNILKDYQILLALRERTKLDGRFFEACPNLELVLQTGGHAYHIDQAAATRQGILVALGRRVSKPTVVVPELVFALLLGLVRQIYPLAIEMKNGGWPEMMGGSLAGRTMGILGYGRHGRPIARLAQAFGMNVVAWERIPSSAKIDESGVKRLPLDELLSTADVVSVHLRLSDEFARSALAWRNCGR